MKRLLAEFTPEGSPVRISAMDIAYKSHREPGSVFGTGQREGVHTDLLFIVDTGGGSGTVEAIEFTFVFYDVFDRFMVSIHGLAGPGHYKVGKKKYRARWIFDLDCGFSQYHVAVFPSQVRLSGGDIWRCDRDECVGWMNKTMIETGEVLTTEIVFQEGSMLEGLND